MCASARICCNACPRPSLRCATRCRALRPSPSRPGPPTHTRSQATCISPRRGGAFLFSFAVPSGYPHDPPKVKCLTKVYHPNIDLEVRGRPRRLLGCLLGALCCAGSRRASLTWRLLAGVQAGGVHRSLPGLTTVDQAALGDCCTSLPLASGRAQLAARCQRSLPLASRRRPQKSCFRGISCAQSLCFHDSSPAGQRLPQHPA